MSPLISIKLEFDIANRLLKQLRMLPVGKLDDLPELIFSLEEAIDAYDA